MKKGTLTIIRLIQEYIELGDDARLKKLHEQYSYRILQEMIDADDVVICDIIAGYFDTKRKEYDLIDDHVRQLNDGSHKIEIEHIFGDYIFYIVAEVNVWTIVHKGNGIDEPFDRGELEYNIINQKIEFSYE